MQPLCKIVIQMSGAPGSGKSTLAKQIAKSLSGVVINHDLIKSFFLENGIPFEQSAKLTYGFQWVLAKEMIEQGQSTVIIDSTCNYQETLDQGLALAQLYNYKYIYVECKVGDLDLLEKRLRGRASMRSQRSSISDSPIDATETRHAEDHRALFKRWIEHPVRPFTHSIIVDTSNSPEHCLEYTLNQIRALALPPDHDTASLNLNSGSVKTKTEVSLNRSATVPPAELTKHDLDLLAGNPVPQLSPGSNL